MNQLIYLCYPVLGALLLWKAKYIRGGQWNEQAFSLEQTKALQGFCALGVMLHHIAQKTCAPWLKQEVIVHGLDVFVPVGYLLVGFFLFAPGMAFIKAFGRSRTICKALAAVVSCCRCWYCSLLIFSSFSCVFK